MNNCITLAFRHWIRSCIRWVLRRSPRFLRELAARVPFSRFHQVASHLFWGEENIHWRGVLLKVNPGEVHGYYPYFLGDYSTDELNKLIELCQGDHLLADVGAHIGQMSLACAHACPKLEVFAFEPSREIADRFRENLSMNPDLASRIELVEKAVSDVDGKVLFQTGPDRGNAGVGRCVVDRKLHPDAHWVSAVRMDSFFKGIGKLPEVVKIDVEGSELLVLKGMEGLFQEGFPKALLVEVHGFYLGEGAYAFKSEVKSILEGQGYALFCLTGQGWQEGVPVEDWLDRAHLLAIRRTL